MAVKEIDITKHDLDRHINPPPYKPLKWWEYLWGKKCYECGTQIIFKKVRKEVKL